MPDTRQHGLYRNALRYWGGNFPVETVDAPASGERRHFAALQAGGNTRHSPSAEVKFVPVARVYRAKSESVSPGKLGKIAEYDDFVIGDTFAYTSRVGSLNMPDGYFIVQKRFS